MIEFVGLPGSGKSALCACLASSLMTQGLAERLQVVALMDQQPGWVVQQRKVADAASFVGHHPSTAFRIVRLVAGSRQSVATAGVTKTINLLAELRRAGSRRPSLVEQGVLQAIWSIDVGAGLPIGPALLDLVDRWLPELVLSVRPPPEDTLQRLQRRVGGRSRADSSAGVDPLVEGRRDLDRLLDHWRSGTPGRQLISVVNSTGTPPAETLDPHLPTIVGRLQAHPISISESEPLSEEKEQL